MNLIKSIAAAAPAVLRDVAGLGGAAMAAYGASQVYEPLGFIVGGAMLMFGAYRLRAIS